MEYNSPELPAPEPQPETEQAPELWAHTPIRITGVPPEMLEPQGDTPERRGFFYGGAVTAFMQDFEEGDFDPDAVENAFRFLDEVVDHFAPTKEQGAVYKFKIRMAAFHGLAKRMKKAAENENRPPRSTGQIVDL